MTTPEEQVVAGGISDAAVRAKTGRGWAERFAILDAFDVRANGHAAAARQVATEHACGDWWSQMVTVAYERERGLREMHQTPDGYEASVSRTFAVPVAALFAAWQDETARHCWLPDAITIRKTTPRKSMRVTWPDETSVSVNFYEKGEGRSQVVVQHLKLSDQAAVARIKVYWAEALQRLGGTLAAEYVCAQEAPKA